MRKAAWPYLILDYSIIGRTRSTKKFYLRGGLEIPTGLHEHDDNYSLAPKVMTIDPEITGEKQHNLRAQYFGATCPYSWKLIWSLFPKKHYVVFGQLLRFYLDRRMRLVKLYLVIYFKSSPPYVASYIANNTAKP